MNYSDSDNDEEEQQEYSQNSYSVDDDSNNDIDSQEAELRRQTAAAVEAIRGYQSKPADKSKKKGGILQSVSKVFGGGKKGDKNKAAVPPLGLPAPLPPSDLDSELSGSQSNDLPSRRASKQSLETGK